MKKLFAILMTLVVMASFVGCAHTEAPAETTAEVCVEAPTEEVCVEPVHTRYVTTGRYHTVGALVTKDGNFWEYSQDIISEEPSYNYEPVYAVFDDNGTPDDIIDDIVVGLVRDTETAIYDELMQALSESFEMEREGNNIRIIAMKEE